VTAALVVAERSRPVPVLKLTKSKMHCGQRRWKHWCMVSVYLPVSNFAWKLL